MNTLYINCIYNNQNQCTMYAETELCQALNFVDIVVMYRLLKFN